MVETRFKRSVDHRKFINGRWATENGDPRTLSKLRAFSFRLGPSECSTRLRALWKRCQARKSIAVIQKANSSSFWRPETSGQSARR